MIGRKVLSALLCLAMVMSFIMPVFSALSDTFNASAAQEEICEHVHSEACGAIPYGHICSEAAGCTPVYQMMTVLQTPGYQHTAECYTLEDFYYHGESCYADAVLICNIPLS